MRFLSLLDQQIVRCEAGLAGIKKNFLARHNGFYIFHTFKKFQIIRGIA
jgi:hypothetical protein